MIIPVIIDLGLWLTPRLSVNILIERFLAIWEALVRMAYTPEQLAALKDALTTVQTMMTQLGAHVNLAEVVTGNWFGAPSSLIPIQDTRLTFISDIILAPLGLSLDLPHVAPSLWRPAPVEVTSVWVMLLILALLWLIGQLLVALYLRWAAADRLVNQSEIGTDTAPRTGLREFLSLALRLTVFSLLLGAMVLVLRLPLSMAATLMLVSGSTVISLLFVLFGGVTLWILVWFLTSFFFVGEAVLLDRQPLWRGIVQSIALVRFNGLSTVGLVLMINLLMLGFRAVWGFMGNTPGGTLLAILGNAYLATSMLLATFAYYEDLRQRWQVYLTEMVQSHQENGNQ